MRKHLLYFTVLFSLVSACNSGRPKADVTENLLPSIFPDYSFLQIPANIAPLNFIIQQDAEQYTVFFSGDQKKGFSVNSSDGKIEIPLEKWKKLLQDNIGDSVSIEVFAKIDSKWHSYRIIRNYVSPDLIDAYIVYRKINPALILWNDMAIVQRSTESFEESAILENRNTGGNCMHCHTFQNRNPENMMMHIRAPGGTYIKTNTTQRWLDTKTAYTIASFAYPSWHPTKNFIAYSTNKIHQAMYASGEHLNVVYDEASDINIYDIEKNIVFTSPEISTGNLENLPEWSADGNALYYINCPKERMLAQGKLVQYDLMRISVDVETQKWGKPDTLISSKITGKSISFPKASPDGRYIIFCMADFGYFTISNPTSDLYLLDLKDNSFRKLNINSEKTESFHDWSLNSRWIVFASKREDGLITLPYFTHIDENGNESKPFVLPAKDPESLITRLYNFNRPVFVTGKVTIQQEDILSTLSNPTEKVVFDTLCIAPDSLAKIKASSASKESSIYRKN
jgi:hypothetical protein